MSDEVADVARFALVDHNLPDPYGVPHTRDKRTDAGRLRFAREVGAAQHVLRPACGCTPRPHPAVVPELCATCGGAILTSQERRG